MRYALLLILVAAISSAISGLAYTQTAEPVPAPASQPSKTPKFLAKFEAKFKSADTDGDGALTLEEAKAGGLNRIVEHFDRLDANHDGKITIEELRDAVRSHLTS